MARYIQSFREAVKDLCLQAWPDLAGQPIPDLYQVHRAILTDELAQFGLPFASVMAADYPSDATGEWGIANWIYLPPVQIYRFEAYTGTVDALEGNLEDMRDFLQSTALSVGQRLSRVTLSSSPYLPVNVVLISKKTDIIAGMVGFDAQVGEVRHA